jgi:hypothetical protein
MRDDNEEPVRPIAARVEEPIRKLDEFKSPVVRSETAEPMFADKEESSSAVFDIEKEEEAFRPTFASGEKENNIRFYYLDAYEDAVKHPSKLSLGCISKEFI